MAEQKNLVHIISWPKEPANLKHKFDTDKPCPVSISFEKTPANVIIHTTPKQPLNVNMDMNLIARETIPLCIKLCEPICAKSQYSIGIDIFDRPVATITLRGMTRLFNCREEEEMKPICADFKGLKTRMEFPNPFTHHELKLSPIGPPLKTVTFGDPVGQIKLAFPPEGIRIEFPDVVSNIKLTANNYAGQSLDFFVYSSTTLIHQFTEQIINEVKVINITKTAMTSVEIKGGKNESSIVEICYEA